MHSSPRPKDQLIEFIVSSDSVSASFYLSWHCMLKDKKVVISNSDTGCECESCGAVDSFSEERVRI